MLPTECLEGESRDWGGAGSVLLDSHRDGSLGGIGNVDSDLRIQM